MRCLRALLAAFVLALLLSACATAQPTAVPVPTATPSPVATAPAVELEKVATLDLPNSFVNTLVFSPDGGTLFTADLNGEVLRWDTNKWTQTVLLAARSTHAADVAANIAYWGTLALSPDGQVLATAFGDQGEVSGLDPMGKELFTFSYGARVYCVEISPDGRYLAVAGLKKNILVYDLHTGRQAADLISDHEDMIALAFSADSSTLLASYRLPERVFTLWDTATWQALETFSLAMQPNNAYHDAVFTPDGKQLAIASTEAVEIKLLDLATKQVVREFREHTKASYQIAFSPDGTLLASVGDDGTLRLWDKQTGLPVSTVRVPRQELCAMTFSPDGALIAFSVWGQGVQVWSVKR